MNAVAGMEAEASRAVGSQHRWGVILAGGEGMRLRPLTRQIAGDDRPKQFCAIVGGESLLQRTRRRISGILPCQQTLLVLNEMQERFYAGQVADAPPASVLIQPCNRGTAAAILYSLLCLREMDPEGVVGFFPCDHHFANEGVFAAHMDSAFAAAAMLPARVVLLGVVAETPEAAYGWLEPGAALPGATPGLVHRVVQVWEKPSALVATRLMKRGCLWNSFVMVGRVRAFLNLIRRTVPGLARRFESMGPSLLAPAGKEALREVYSGISAASFCQEVLAACPFYLLVQRCSDLGWTDLGEPSRVLALLERMSIEGEPKCTRAVTPVTIPIREPMLT